MSDNTIKLGYYDETFSDVHVHPTLQCKYPYSTAVDGYIQLLTFHAHFPSLIFTALAITEMRDASEFSMREHRMHFVSGMQTDRENIFKF